jgi:flagellar biosynthesis protein FliQ
MSDADAIDLIQKAIWVTMVSAGPIVVSVMIVGSAIALLQALTQIQEMTLTFLPKLALAFLVIVLSGPYVGALLYTFTEDVYARIETGFVAR